MAVPKRRKSRSRIKQRHGAGSHKRPTPSRATCPQCSAPRQPHRVCPSCGYYRGRQVVSVTAES